MYEQLIVYSGQWSVDGCKLIVKSLFESGSQYIIRQREVSPYTKCFFLLSFPIISSVSESVGTEQQSRMAPSDSKTKTRSGGKIYNFDSDFPATKSYVPSDKLPTYKSVVGMLRHLLEGTGQGRGVTVDMVCREVAKQVMAKWFHDTVYHKSIDSIIKSLKALHNTYIMGKKRQAGGRLDSKDYLNFVELFEKKDKLIDIYPGLEQGNYSRISKCVEEWDGLRMNDRDRLYYEDQKGPRIMVCENRCDPTYYLTLLKHRRELERKAEWKKQKEDQFLYKDLNFMKKSLIEDGYLEYSASQGEEDNVEAEEKCDEEPPQKKNKTKEYESKENAKDSIPAKFQHIRESERKVKSEFYQTCAALTGSGLSIPEAASAIVTVGNKMFDRDWKTAVKDSATFDNNTAPDDRNIRTSLQLQEVAGMARMVDLVKEGREQGRAITHASDSTTKKGAGQFMVSGKLSFCQIFKPDYLLFRYPYWPGHSAGPAHFVHLWRDHRGYRHAGGHGDGGPSSQQRDEGK